MVWCHVQGGSAMSKGGTLGVPWCLCVAGLPVGSSGVFDLCSNMAGASLGALQWKERSCSNRPRA